MQPKLIAGSSHPALAEATARILDLRLVSRQIERFPDGELHVQLDESVRGEDVYVIQPTGPPVDERIFELLLLADACRRAGAAGVTAVVPYFGYARQDRRARGREPVAARLVADLLATAGVRRVVAVDLHVTSLEGFFPVPLEHLTAVPLMVEGLRGLIPPDSVIVSPDLGAAKLAERYARALQLPVAVVHKQRLSGEDVQVRAIAGEVRGRAPVIVDDMISTGGTIVRAAEALLAAGCRREIWVAATHGVCSGDALERLRRLGIQALLVSDSLPLSPSADARLEIIALAPLLADAIDRLHHGRSMGRVLLHD